MFFHGVAEGAPDPIFGLTGAFRKDPRPHKIDLLVGIYKNENLQAELLPVVKKAKEEIFPQDLLADYLAIDGMAEFTDEIGALAFGQNVWKKELGRIYAAQTAGGTAALRIGGEFLFQEVTKKIYLPNPTWPNHRSVFEKAGCQVETYAYYDKKKHRLDFEGMQHDFARLPAKSCVLLHAACHNPSGCDPSESEWKEISQIMKEKQLLPFFDFAYQGIGDGIEQDRKAIEIFMQDGHEMLIAYSCSKNFSLYCQRTGALFVVGLDSSTKVKLGSQIKRIIRTLYSNPPAHGAKIATHILKNEKLKKEWEAELKEMRMRMSNMRKLLVEKLTQKNPYFEFMRHHKGMFSFADLDKTQVKRLIENYAIYMIDNGRISIPGLNHHNIDSVVNALLAVCE